MLQRLNRAGCSHLGASVGTGKQDTGSLAGKSGSLARLAKIAQRRNDGLDGPFLAEAGLDRSQQGSNDDNLGVHGECEVVSRNKNRRPAERL